MLIDAARLHGSEIALRLGHDAEIIDVSVESGIPGVGPGWMPPIAAAERLREFLAARKALPATSAAPIYVVERPTHTYVFRGVINRVIDGDTVVADINLGFRVWRKDQVIRLLHVSAPEKNRPESKEAGLAAKKCLEGMFAACPKLLIKSEHLDAFGRMLGMVWLDMEGETASVNQRMLESGLDGVTVWSPKLVEIDGDTLPRSLAETLPKLDALLEHFDIKKPSDEAIAAALERGWSELTEEPY